MKDYENIYLNLLTTLPIVLTLLDELEGTTAYRHAMKFHAKNLKSEIIRLMDSDLDGITGVNDKALNAQIRYKEEFIDKVSLLQCHDFGIVSAMIDAYKANGEAVLEALKVKVIEDEGKDIKRD